MPAIFFLALWVLWFSLFVAACVGWIMNIITVVGLGFGDFTAELIVRLVGVPVPVIGAIMGWL